MASVPQVYAGPPVAHLDARSDSRVWLEALRSDGPDRDVAVRCLHALLLRAARFELSRRRAALAHVRLDELEDLAMQATDDALVAVLAKLRKFRGDSRFTTWAYKFVLLETAVRLRRRAWEGREVVLEPERWPAIADPAASPHELAVARERLAALQRGVDDVLTTHQREVFVGARAQRRADRRARRAPRQHPRRALQDAARRAAQAARAPGGIAVSAHIDALLGPAGPEVGCEACFDWLDAYVELELAGADVDEAFAGMRAHLDGCPACREEHDSLRDLVAGDPEVPRRRER